MANTSKYAWLHFGHGVDWRHVKKALLLQLNALGRTRHQIIEVTSGYRSKGQQAVLYNRYVKSGKNIKYIAAPPGHSMHESGWAVDATIGGKPLSSVVSKKQLYEFGLAAPVKGDPVHIQLANGPTSNSSAASSAPTPTASTGPAEGAAVLPDYAGQLPTDQAQTGPVGALPAGTVPAGGFSPRLLQQTWQLIASQPGASQDTLDYAKQLS